MYDHRLCTLAGEHLIREHVDPKELNPQVFKEDEFCQVQSIFFFPPVFQPCLHNIYCLSKKFLNKREQMIFIIIIA